MNRQRSNAGIQAASGAATLPGSPITRTQAVWAVLVMAMTAVGGALWLLDRSSGITPRLDGLALASLVSADQPPSIDQIFKTRQPIERSRWKAIVIQDSRTSSGTAETLAARSGSPFHFLVGNGRGMDDGGLYVDHRWLLQEVAGASTGPDGAWYNQNAIRINLVGDGEQGEFSQAQVDRLVELVSALARKLGIPAENVRLESDVSRNRSPGRFFPGAEFHERLASSLR